MRKFKVTLRSTDSRKNKNIQYWKLDFSPSILNPRTGKMVRFHSTGLHTYKKPKNFNEKEHNEAINTLLNKMKIKVYKPVKLTTLNRCKLTTLFPRMECIFLAADY